MWFSGAIGALGKILSLIVDGYGLVNANVLDDEQLCPPSLYLWLCVVTLFCLLWVPAVHSSYFMATVARQCTVSENFSCHR